MLNMHDAGFNVRQLVKELLLLEDHMSCVDKQCRECIVKHALKSEAWIEEGLTLNPEVHIRDLLLSLYPAVRRIADAVIAGVDYSTLAHDVRVIRRALQKSII